MASSVKCLSFSVAILFVGAVCGLKCYFCDSSSGDLCDQNKNFTALPLENCPAEVPSWFGEIYCARMTVKVTDEEGGGSYVVRGCMPKVSCEIMRVNNAQKNRNFTVTECYVCKSDLCNSKRRYKRGRLVQEARFD